MTLRRLAGGRPGALVILLALVALIVIGINAGGQYRVKKLKPGGPNDATLYRTVIDAVHAGTPYYVAAAEAQRRGGYPLRPFVTTRLPTLATAMAVLPNEQVRRGVLGALQVAVVLAWGWRLLREGVGTASALAGAVLVATGVGVAAMPGAYPFHEAWAGLLIALSLALRRPGRWGASLALGLLAALTRELAAPYLLVMAVLAWRDGQRREALAWVAAIALVALALVAHAQAVAAVVLPGDLSSQGWLRAGGWPFVVRTARWNGLLIGQPQWMIALAAPPAMAALAFWRGPLGERLALTVLGYAAAFMVVGRPENHNWGLLIAPLWPLGLLLAPAMLRATLRTLFVAPSPRP